LLNRVRSNQVGGFMIELQHRGKIELSVTRAPRFVPRSSAFVRAKFP
jgi:hypothetical protein